MLNSTVHAQDDRAVCLLICDELFLEACIHLYISISINDLIVCHCTLCNINKIKKKIQLGNYAASFSELALTTSLELLITITTFAKKEHDKYLFNYENECDYFLVLFLVY